MAVASQNADSLPVFLPAVEEQNEQQHPEPHDTRDGDLQLKAANQSFDSARKITSSVLYCTTQSDESPFVEQLKILV